MPAAAVKQVVCLVLINRIFKHVVEVKFSVCEKILETYCEAD